MKFIKLNLPVQLAIIFILLVLFGNHLPVEFKSGCLALSLSLKTGLQFALPFIIFGCLFSSLLEQQDKAFGFVLTLFLLVSVSNLISTLTGYWVGSAVLKHLHIDLHQHALAVAKLEPLWNLHLKNPLSNGVALVSAISAGLYFSVRPSTRAKVVAVQLNQAVYFFLKKIFVPLLPLFALGFIVKMQHEGVLVKLFHSYLPLAFLIIGTNIVYLFTLFLIAAGGKVKTSINFIKNSLPAGLIGFTTMSSLAAMPLTLEATRQNIGKDEFAKIIIPATVNVHMIGSSIVIPILALYILLTFGHAMPDFSKYLVFAQFFVIAKFTVAAVPCGSIIVMLPLLESHLGFSGEMSALVTTMYLVFNPFTAASNVLGNSAFAIMLSKFFARRASKSKVISTHSIKNLHKKAVHNA